MTKKGKTQAQRQGYKIEQLAAAYLQQQGVQLITQNMLCRYGEIDIIAKQNNTLIFVEVRFRENTNFGSGAETVNWVKQRKIIKSAQYYLQTKRLNDKVNCRFDVISASCEARENAEKKYVFEWIQNAFDHPND